MDSKLNGIPQIVDRSTTDFSFDWLMNPINREEFFSEYFEQKHLHLQREDSNYFSKLLSVDVIEEFLFSQVVKYPAVKLTKSNEEIQPDKYVVNGRVIPSQILKYVSEGATLILSGLHDFIPNLSLFCAFLLKEFGHRFQTNIYITPKQSQGFNIHYDTHDVFVLQVQGRKKWRLYENNPIKLPNKMQDFEADKYSPGPLAHEFILEEGDLLYIPRGMMHDADTLDEMSVHITTGMLGYTWTDMLIEGILNLSKNDPELRRYVPCDLMSGNRDIAGFKGQLEHIFNRLEDQLDLGGMVSRMRKDLLTNQKNNLSGILNTAINIDSVNTETSFSVREGVLLSITKTDENIVLEWLGKSVKVPAYTEPAIEFITNETFDEFTQADLPDCMDEDGKITLLKRLAKEGYLSIN